MSVEEQTIQAPPSSLGANSSRKVIELTSPSRLTFRWEIAFVGAALLVVCGHLLIKGGLNAVAVGTHISLSSKLLLIIQQPQVLLGLGIYGLGTLCWMAAVAQTELSLLYPLTSLNYILIAFLSYAIFDEKISIKRGSGIALIALGMVMITKSHRKKVS